MVFRKGFSAMKMTVCVLLLSVMATSRVRAADPDPLKDVCVADFNSTLSVNGFPCKDMKNVVAEDFRKGLNMAGDTSNALGTAMTAANVMKLPGLNTHGISMALIDFAKGGLNPPHTHPRATEILLVVKGSLYVGFVTTDDKLLAMKINDGDAFVFPRGLVHFQLNVGYENAVAIAGLSSQLPGTQQIARSLFSSDPAIELTVLSKAFQLDAHLLKHLQGLSWPSV